MMVEKTWNTVNLRKLEVNQRCVEGNNDKAKSSLLF